MLPKQWASSPLPSPQVLCHVPTAASALLCLAPTTHLHPTIPPFLWPLMLPFPLYLLSAPLRPLCPHLSTCPMWHSLFLFLLWPCPLQCPSSRAALPHLRQTLVASIPPIPYLSPRYNPPHTLPPTLSRNWLGSLSRWICDSVLTVMIGSWEICITKVVMWLNRWYNACRVFGDLEVNNICINSWTIP